MKHTLQLKLSQHLALTPQLQQSIRLLQLSTLELNQELEHFIEANPLLERVEPGTEAAIPAGEDTFDAPQTGNEPEAAEAESEPDIGPAPEDFMESRWDEESAPYAARDGDDEPEYPQVAAETPTLREHLNWQLNLTQLSPRDKTIVSILIDALNEDGYLTQSLDEIAAMLPPELEIDPVELHASLNHLQNLDPPGIGARTLGECLALQLEAMPADTPGRDLALSIARQHLEALGARDYNKLKKLLHCNDEALRGAQNLIVHLNPRPGADFTPPDTRYVVPDVIVRKIKGAWTVNLNHEAMPRLRINRIYADILQRHRDSTGHHLASQLQEARWLIKNVQQRFDTILRVSQAIVERQRHFLEHGEVAMRPLVLREIAEAVDLHESTVSRVTTQKYMLTPRGIFELKYFFGSHVATETGGACSATAIRALIKQLVAAEDSKKPLSDTQLTEILAQQGIIVARRTVAKYRESLQIPAVNLRKSL
ncbi:MAG: RNA polymerase factor sigma-54 [Pseudomonadota bacterium]